MRGTLGLLLTLVCCAAGAVPAVAAPPAAGGLEPTVGVSCIGSTTLATGCPAQSPVLQAVGDVAISADGNTIYVTTTYAGGAVAAVRRQADGSLGAVLGCAASTASAACATVIPSLSGAAGLLVGPAGQLIVRGVGGSNSVVTAVSTGADGNIGALLNCVATAPVSGSAAGCTTRDGLYLAQDIAISPGGTLYVASFGNYTEGTVIALSTTASGAISGELSCWQSTNSSPSSSCPGNVNSTGKIASPTSVVVGPEGVVYVGSSEYQANYGVVTAFPVAPGGAMLAPINCVSDPTGTYPVQPCADKVPGIKGVRQLAISPDSRLYVGARSQTLGSVAAFSLLGSGGVGAQLNCLGSEPATGCPTAAGLRGVTGLVVAPDGTVYVSSDYGSSDGAAVALARQQNGAFSGEINCVGVTSGTGCALRMSGLPGAAGIAGSPDAAMQNLYVAGRYASEFLQSGTDGAIAALTRELPPRCVDGSAAVAFDTATTISLPCDDPNRDGLTSTVVGAPAHGTLDAIDQATGTVVYRPAAGYSGPDSFAIKSSDGTLESAVATVGVAVGAAPAPAPTPAPGVTPRAAKVTSFSLSRKRFAVAAKPTATSATAKGTTFRYGVDLAGRVRITISSCRRGTGKQRKNPCARLTSRGSLTRTAAKPGSARLAFSGRIGKRALQPGRYRARIIIAPAAPNLVSAARTVDFTVVRR